MNQFIKSTGLMILIGTGFYFLYEPVKSKYIENKNLIEVELKKEEEESKQKILKEHFTEVIAKKPPLNWSQIEGTGIMLGTKIDKEYFSINCSNPVFLKAAFVGSSYVGSFLSFVDNKWYISNVSKDSVQKNELINHINSCVSELDSSIQRIKKSKEKSLKSWEH